MFLHTSLVFVSWECGASEMTSDFGESARALFGLCFLSERGCVFTSPFSLNVFVPHTDITIFIINGVGMVQSVQSIKVFNFSELFNSSF